MVSQLHQTDSLVVSQIYFIHIKIVFVCFHVTGENEVIFSMCLPDIFPSLDTFVGFGDILY